MKKRPPDDESGNSGGASEPPRPTPTYEVGYGKPPVEKRFKPGRSGNPKGRPPDDPSDVRKDLRGILEQRVTIRDKTGRRYTITKVAAAMTQLLNEAAKGDLPSLKQLLSVLQLVYGKELPPLKPIVNFVIEG